MQTIVNGGAVDSRFVFRVDATPRTAGAVTTSGGTVTIADTNTTAWVGDIFRAEDGPLQFLEIPIIDVASDGDSFTIASPVMLDPGDTFYILRHVTQQLNDEGNQEVSVTQGPLTFVLDSVTTEVEQDTATPANSRPLPVINFDGSGVEIDYATETTLSAINTKTPALVSGAVPVTDAAAESSLASIDGKIVTVDTSQVTISSALPSGANPIGSVDVGNFPASQTVNGTVAATQSGTWDVADITGTVSLPTGAATETTLAAASAKLPATLGQKTMANSLAVVLASDQSAVSTNESVSATATLSNVASSASSVSLLASNSSRKGAMIFNDSTQVLYVKLGATASTTSYTVQIAASGYYELPPAHIYTGAIDGIWASANGNARITELT
jgi:hypothetical protein